jgi:hypothetical protein
MQTSDAVTQSVSNCKYGHNWRASVFTQDEQRQRETPIVCGRCAAIPKEKERQKAEAIVHLREVLKPGDTVYTVLRHVSRSGMSRNIDLYMADNKPVWISAYVGHANWQSAVTQELGTVARFDCWRVRNGHGIPLGLQPWPSAVS